MVEYPATRMLRVVVLLVIDELLFSVVVYRGDRSLYAWSPEPA
jgi:hypothetical protein